MDAMNYVQSKFKRVDSKTLMKNEENLTMNSKELNPPKEPAFFFGEIQSPIRRRGSIECLSPISASTRKRKVARNSLPPKVIRGAVDQAEFRKKTKMDLIKEWKKEEKLKFELVTAYKQSSRSLKEIPPSK